MESHIPTETRECSYLLDELIGLEKHQRLTTGAEAAILEETVESSYRKGGEHASLTAQVSKQTVKKLVHQTVIEMPIEEAAEKKKSNGYISTQMKIMCQHSSMKRKAI